MGRCTGEIIVSETEFFQEKDFSELDELSSVYEIEGALLSVKELDSKISFLKGLKQHRAAILDDKIKSLSGKVDKIREVILTTMKTHSPKQKTIEFPGVAKISRRQNKDS